MRISRVLPEILRLSPERDHQRIAFLSAAVDFPWDTQRAYELALLRTFAAPKSSSLLVATKEFTLRTQKRYDDTSILISTLGFYGYDSPQGRAALRRMNGLHRPHAIANDEFLYVLSTFALEPIRWNAKYGWRSLSENERQASYCFWREVGRRMNIAGIPGSLEALERWSLAYERSHFAYSPYNQALAEAVRDLFCSWILPRPLWPLGAQLVYAVLEPELLRAFGFPRPRLWAKVAVKLGLKARAALLRLLPARTRPYRLQKTRSYPQGYRLETLGPEEKAGVTTAEPPY